MQAGKETQAVTFTVHGVEPVHGVGRLVALAIVVVEVEGVELVLQGVQVVRDSVGWLQVRAPMFRHPRLGWTPAVVLPPALSAALSAEILAMVRGKGQE